MKTDVHHNADRTLTVLPKFVQRKFGTWKTPNVSGACLLMQLGSIYHRQLGVSHRRIQQALIEFVTKRGYINSSGLPLVDTIEAFNALSEWKLKSCNLHTTDSVITALEGGSPVMLVVDPSLMDHDSDHAFDPIMRVNPWREQLSVGGSYNHALLIIGYDHAEQLLIVRDSRHHYTRFNGMIKMRVADLLKWKRGWKMIELVFTKEHDPIC
jgi:hypothetical protein